MPAGTYSNMQYNYEGQLTQYGTPAGVMNPIDNVRGELAFDPTTNTRFQSDYGFMVPRPASGGTSASYNTDAKEGVMTGSDSFQGDTDLPFTWSYDAAGRQTGTTGTFAAFIGNNEYGLSGSYTRTFDVENHISSQSYTTYQTNYAYPCGSRLHYTNNSNASYEGLYVQYEWGPNGHPIKIGSTALGAAPGNTGPSTPPPTSTVQYDTLHWDGDVLLFTTNSSGAVDDIKIGSLGDLTPLDPAFTGFTVWDRDKSGSIVSSHNNSLAGGAIGHGVWSPQDPYLSKCRAGAVWATATTGFVGPSTFAGGTSNGATNLVGRGGLLVELRTDGIGDGYNSIQGARSYDSDQGAWTTPDAFPGVAHDPESQRPYVWNRNSSLEYSDPTGYFPSIGNQGGGSLLFDPYSEGSFVQDAASSAHDIAALRAYTTTYLGLVDIRTGELVTTAAESHYVFANYTTVLRDQVHSGQVLGMTSTDNGVNWTVRFNVPPGAHMVLVEATGFTNTGDAVVGVGSKFDIEGGSTGTAGWGKIGPMPLGFNAETIAILRITVIFDTGQTGQASWIQAWPTI